MPFAGFRRPSRILKDFETFGHTHAGQKAKGMTTRKDPIARTLKAFAVGYAFGFLTLLVLAVLLGDSWIPCVGGCTKNQEGVPPLARVRQPREYMYGRPGMSAASTRSVFTTNGSTNMCPDGYLRVLVLVLSNPHGLESRNTIRSTWLRGLPTLADPNCILKWKFIIGTKNISNNASHQLRTEQEFFNDLLLLPDLIDDYRNLTLKIWMSMKWASRLVSDFKFDFIVKADDDSYVRLDKLVSTVRKLNCDDRLYWGYFTGCSAPQSTGRWSESKWNTCPHYLPYAMGGGYVVSRKVVHLITRYADRLRLYNNEDVTTGSWLAPYKLVRKHDLRFDVESHKHGCNNNYIFAHKQITRRDMEEKFNNLRVNGTLCTVEKEIRPAYVYNWTARPLDCCKRSKHLPVLDIDP